MGNNDKLLSVFMIFDTYNMKYWKNPYNRKVLVIEN